MSIKTPVTPSGIQPVTFWLLEQCLNPLRHRLRPNVIYKNKVIYVGNVMICWTYERMFSGQAFLKSL
jgi:hypothetical protein